MVSAKAPDGLEAVDWTLLTNVPYFRCHRKDKLV